MARGQSIFPVRNPVDAEASPSIQSLDAADDVFESLRSATARDLVNEIYERPATASDLADAVGTSLQNVQYHMQRLLDAGLVEAVGTWYSERGTEMTVYGPAADPFVIVAGPSENGTSARSTLQQAIDGTSARPRDYS